MLTSGLWVEKHLTIIIIDDTSTVLNSCGKGQIVIDSLIGCESGHCGNNSSLSTAKGYKIIALLNSEVTY